VGCWHGHSETRRFSVSACEVCKKKQKQIFRYGSLCILHSLIALQAAFQLPPHVQPHVRAKLHAKMLKPAGRNHSTQHPETLQPRFVIDCIETYGWQPRMDILPVCMQCPNIRGNRRGEKGELCATYRLGLRRPEGLRPARAWSVSGKPWFLLRCAFSSSFTKGRGREAG
jgi:hypothetical protein